MGHGSRSQWCAEVMAFAFGDLLVDVAHLHQGAATSAYVLGEGARARLAVDGDRFPDPRRFPLLRAVDDDRFVLAIPPATTGVVIDGAGRRSLAQRLATATATTDEDSVRRIELVPGEQIWLALGPLRLRVRLVPREAPALSPPAVDRPWLASLGSCALVAGVALALLRALPTPTAYQLEVEADDRRAAVARLLPKPKPEPEPEPESLESVHGDEPETSTSERRRRAVKGKPPKPAPHPTTPPRSRPEPRWVPANAAAAVGQMGRRYDPVAAARRAGILGLIGDLDLAGTSAFAPGLDDRALWATTQAEPTPPDWMLGGVQAHRRSQGEDLIGLGDIGLIGPDLHHESSRLGQFSPRPPLSIHVTAPISADVTPARRVIRNHTVELLACREKFALPRHGTVLIDLNVGHNQVGPVLVRTPQGQAFATCLRTSFQAFKFSLSRRGELHSVHVELRFR